MKEQRYPEPTVGALIFNPEGQLLLVKTHKWHGKYTIPGGHVELGEQLTEAVQREVKEETGLDVLETEFLCFQEFIYDNSFWQKRHFIFFDFICRVGNEEVTLNDEAEEYRWVEVEEVNTYPIDSYLQYSLEVYSER